MIKKSDNNNKCYGYVKKCVDKSQIGIYNSININDQIYLIEFVSSNIKKIPGYDIVLMKKKYDEHDRFVGYNFVKKIYKK